MSCGQDHKVQVCPWCGGAVLLSENEDGIPHQECVECTAGWDAPQWALDEWRAKQEK